MVRIAVIGGGRIGEALITGLLESGWDKEDLVIVGRTPVRAGSLQQRFGIRVTDNVTDAADAADLIVIAVKPHDVDPVLTELSESTPNSGRDQVLVSLAAGVPTTRLESALPGFPAARVMPNTAIAIGRGMSVIAAGRYLREEHMRMVSQVFGAVGEVVTVAESQMDAVTAVSGSGPAYFFLVAEVMIDGAVHMGLSRDIADQLVRQTMLGSAALLKTSGLTVAQLRASITPAEGATAAAVRELEQRAVRSVFHEAFNAAARWSLEPGATRTLQC